MLTLQGELGVTVSPAATQETNGGGPSMSAQRDLLKTWYDRSAGNQYLHYVAADHYRKATYLLGVPVIVLSAAVGTSVFASLQQQPTLWVQVSIGLASVVAAVLASLQTFLRYGERSELHRLAGAKYGAVGREIEHFLSRSDILADDQISELRKRIDALGLDSPNVPRFLIAKARHWTPALLAGVAGNKPGAP
jgi:hypothetical protein